VAQVQFICLAHSKKYNERCVAGVRLDSAEWVRPVSRKEHGELAPAQLRFADGGEPHNFDVISAMLGEHVPVRNQPENWRVQNAPWKLLSRPAPAECSAILRKALFRGSVLFGNTTDRVHYSAFENAPAKESLILVKPEHPRWTAKRTLTWKRQLRVCFGLGGVNYDLAVTDIPYDDKLKELELGEHTSGQLGIQDEKATYFTVSLGEPFEGGNCFKLVAAVLQLPPDWPSLE
jgi:hypothetical protein